jgi:molybdenum transport protein
MHRLGLSESLLVFPEHRLFLAPEVLHQRLVALRSSQPEKRLVVEVGDTAEALAMAAAGAEVLQLERFTPEALRNLKVELAARGLKPLVAPAGGVTAANAVAYAQAGADFLVSSALYHAPPTDVKVRFSSAATAST